MKRTLYAICLLLTASQAAQALSYATPESSFAHHLATSAGLFARENEGRSPASWSDLQPYLNSPIDEEYPYITPTKRYALLEQPHRLPPPHEGDLIIVTRRPFRDSSLYTNWYGGISHGPVKSIAAKPLMAQFRFNIIAQ